MFLHQVKYGVRLVAATAMQPDVVDHVEEIVLEAVSVPFELNLAKDPTNIKTALCQIERMCLQTSNPTLPVPGA